MALSNEEIERIHKQGKMPDWVYYQTNNKSPQENIEEQRDKIREQINSRYIKEELTREIQEILNDILSNLSI